MRAFCRARPPGAARTLLLFGCRDDAADRLYAADFEACANLEVDVSVSRHRVAERRARVTAAVARRGAELADLIINQGARVYIAGNAQMAADVSGALAAALETHGGLKTSGGAKLLRRLDGEGRFAVEAFG